MAVYHVESWSEQAREMSNIVINHVNSGTWCIEQAFRFFRVSYRPRLIRHRAARRFRRYVRAGKVHETPESVVKWKEYKEKYGQYLAPDNCN